MESKPLLHMPHLKHSLCQDFPRANICSAWYTQPPHRGQPWPSGARAIERGSNIAPLRTSPGLDGNNDVRRRRERKNGGGERMPVSATEATSRQLLVVGNGGVGVGVR